MSNEYKEWEQDKIEEEKQYVTKYPFLHIRGIDGELDTTYKFPMINLEIPDGWYDLFFQLCDDLKSIAPENLYFLQVKEKYNYLRCYAVNSTPEVDALLDKYEQISYHVCTVCGAPADKVTTGYIASYCEGCFRDHVKNEQSVNIKAPPDSLEWQAYLDRIK